MKNTKKCISLTLAAALLLTGCGGGASDNSGSTSAANGGDKKVLTFGCQMYTDGIVNTVTDENGGWNAMRYGITEGLFKSLGLALKEAVRLEGTQTPSTKGVL